MLTSNAGIAWGLLLVLWAPVGAAMPCLGDCTPGGETVVQVVLDLDAERPGFQSNLNVPPTTPVVNGVAVYVLDPAQQSCLWGIGYLGGIDRGIALGHMPNNANRGVVEGFAAHLGTPIVPDNFAVVFGPPGLDPGFVGPEVQYVEGGADQPAAIPAVPAAPIFTVDITLAGAEAGDVFDFYLLDLVVVWSEGIAGVFSTQGQLSLDSGGDAVADGTLTIHGVDPDAPRPVPPATFLVDYIDGPPEGGPATITVLRLGDLDGDGIVGILDFLDLLAAWGPCPPACPPACLADLDGDCSVGILDLLILLGNWG